MRLEELIRPIAEHWRGEFVRFIQTGEASEEFLNYLDSDPACQAAVEEAFTAQSASLEQLAKLVRDPGALAQASAAPRSDEVAAELVKSLRKATELTRKEQQEVAERVGKALSAVVPQDRAQAIVADLESSVARAAG